MRRGLQSMNSPRCWTIIRPVMHNGARARPLVLYIIRVVKMQPYPKFTGQHSNTKAL